MTDTKIILKEMLREAQTELAKKTKELAKKTEALAEEETKAVATAKLLEEVAKGKLERNKQRYDEAERAKIVLNKLKRRTNTKALVMRAKPKLVSRS